MKLTEPTLLLSKNDPDPVEVVNPDSDASVVLVCEHAGQAVPQSLGTLGVSQEVLDSHRGWDIGAEAVARKMADQLNAPLVLQRYSRLVIDANRPPRAAGSMVEISEGIPIPGNQGVTAEDRDARVAEIFDPFDRAIVNQLTRHVRGGAFSIHSFTPVFEGQNRPWHLGLLARRRPTVSERLRALIQAARPEAVIALNEPYQIDEASDWFIPVHAEPRGIPHCLFEIRNDLIGDPVGVSTWANLLADGVAALMEDA